MTDLDHPPIIDLDDHRSIAVRRKRRSTNSLNSHSRNNSTSSATLNHGINTPPATPNTPKRSKKRVRFSDPGPNLLSAEPSASSGLTPFIRRASLSSATKSTKRRHSTPATLSNRSQYHDEAPLSGTLQFAPLRQVLDGRVKRRLRRNRLSEEVNNIEWDKRHEARSRKLEVERLRNELRDKDMEMQSMRDEQDIASQLEGESGSPVTTTSRLSTRVSELEQQISELKAELERKESARHDESHWDPDWTMAAKDPFHDGDDEYEDDFMITNYDDDFGDGNDELMTTPTRLNTSFPSPPSTLPNTPCMQQGTSSPSRSSHSDAEKDVLKSQLESLQSEIQKLTSTIAFKEDNHLRLTEKLSDYIPQDESHDHSTLDSALDTVLTQLALTQATCQERNAAFKALTSEISSLGFASSGPEETIQTIAQSFRQARLDLEYLTPGENPVGFENDKLLEMLVSRIKVLLEKVKERDESIDQYHSQEVLLRQQLNTRVDALLDVQKELCLATSVVTDLRNEIEEKEIGTERLKSALDGYRDEVNGLEALICKMETKESTLRSQLSETEERLQDEVHSHETTRTCIQGNDILLSEYSNRLTTALQATTTLQQEIHTLEQKHQEEKQTLQTLINDRDVSTLEREKKHGEDLALRDVRVNQLRTEMERVNAALHSAHASIMGLRNRNRELEQQVEGEKKRGRFVVQSMRQQLAGVLGIGEGYLNGDVAVRGLEDEPQGQNDEEMISDGSRAGGANGESGDSSPITQKQPGRISSSVAPVIRRGFFLDGRLARRRSSEFGVSKEKKRRRYDSGLGFLDEHGEGEEEEGEMGGDEMMDEIMGVEV